MVNVLGRKDWSTRSAAASPITPVEAQLGQGPLATARMVEAHPDDMSEVTSWDGMAGDAKPKRRNAMTTCSEIGQRASALRTSLGLSMAEVAGRASLDVTDVERFERTGEATLASLVALHEALSHDDALEQIFTVPRFDDISQVIAFERLRTARE